MSVLLVVIVLAIGISTMNNFDKMEAVQDSIETLSQSVGGQEQTEEAASEAEEKSAPAEQEEAVEAVSYTHLDVYKRQKYGCMMGVSNDKIIHVPLSEVAGKLKYVDPDSEIIQEAKRTGISFGDK